jgi:peptidoglycan/LPS O-acetylase OafA/YrhL
MVGHSLNYYATPGWFHELALIFNGRAAVVVFFVLSGYVLTCSLQNKRFDRPTILRFYIQRVFRIYPAIWAASALGLAYLFELHWRIPVADVSEGVRRQFRPDRMDLLHIVASFAGMLAFILPQLWSIFVEILGSAAMPFIAFVTLHRYRWTAVMLAVAIFASYAIGKYTYYNFGLYFVDFVAGAALAMPENPVARAIRDSPARPLVAVGLVALSLTQFIPLSYYSPTAHIIETALATGIIGLLVYAKQRIGYLSSKALVFIGDISFSIYLLHYVVLCTLAKIFSVIEAQVGVRLEPIALAMVLACTTCVLTVPLSALSYNFIEKPGIWLGKTMLARFPRQLESIAEKRALPAHET